jgi:hypothetical protein
MKHKNIDNFINYLNSLRLDFNINSPKPHIITYQINNIYITIYGIINCCLCFDNLNNSNDASYDLIKQYNTTIININKLLKKEIRKQKLKNISC